MESLMAAAGYGLRSLSSLWSNPIDQSNNLNIRITNNSGFRMVLHEAYGKYGVYVLRPVNIPIAGTCTFKMRPDPNPENGTEGIVQYFVQNAPRTLLSLSFTCNDANINTCRMQSVPAGAFAFIYDVDELTIDRQNPLRVDIQVVGPSD